MEYESSFKHYCERRLCELPADIFAKKGDANNLYVKIDKHFSEATADDIKKLAVRLSELLETNLYILKIDEGCIRLTTITVCSIHTPLTPEQVQGLKKMKVIRLYSNSQEYFNINSVAPAVSSGVMISKNNNRLFFCLKNHRFLWQ